MSKRLASYPLWTAECAAPAAAYGKCVSEYLGEVKHLQCDKEFRAFKECVRKKAFKAGFKRL